MLPILRFAITAAALYQLGNLLFQFASGSISMGYGEFDDRIVVTSLFGRTMAVLMWAPFLGGLIVAGVRPALYSQHRWLLPSLLVAICAAFAVFSVTRPYAFQ